MALWVFDVHLNSLLASQWSFLPIVSGGYLGVPVFFMLSIYLLLKSLDQNPDLKHYFLRRVKRIWPMYFISVGLVFLYYHPGDWDWLFLTTSFTGIFGNTHIIGYVFWSLQVEEVAYLFFPLISKSKNQELIAWGLIVTGFVAMLTIWKAGLSLELGWWWVPVSLPAYGFGILAYLKKIPHLALYTLPFILLYFDSNYYFVTASMFVMPGFAYIIQTADRRKWLKHRALVFIGDISYGIYLLHYLLIDIFGWLSVIVAIPAAWAFEKFGAFISRRAPAKRLVNQQ